MGCGILTNEDLPVFDSLRDVVGTAHLAVCDTPDDEDDQTRTALVAGLAFLLVPLSIACTANTALRFNNLDLDVATHLFLLHDTPAYGNESEYQVWLQRFSSPEDIQTL